MKKLTFVAVILMLVLFVSACGTKTVEITVDNWDTYFEFRRVHAWGEVNAFGDPPSSVEYPTVLAVKEEYVDKILMDQVDLAVECIWSETERVVNVDWANKQLSFGDTIANPIQMSDSQICEVKEILCWGAYESAYVVCYLRDIGIANDHLLRDEQGNMYATAMEDFAVKRIQGTITIKE